MRFSILGVLLLATVLSGCAEGARYSTLPNITNYYDPTLVWHATRKGGMPTVIHGNPFSVPKAAANAHVLESLHLPNRFEPAPFKLLADPDPVNYRIVLVFNADPPWLGFQQACGDLSEVKLRPASEIVALHAAFCIGTRVITELDTRGVANGPNDPGFESLMREAVEDLLPAFGTQKQFSPRS